MSAFFLDTDILIDQLRGYQLARIYLEAYETGASKGFIASITVAEPASGKMTGQNEEARVKQLLSLFEIVSLEQTTAWVAGELRRKYKLGLADAVIAATAISQNLPLITRNLIHFGQVSGLQVIKPYQ